MPPKQAGRLAGRLRCPTTPVQEGMVKKDLATIETEVTGLRQVASAQQTELVRLRRSAGRV